MLFGLTVDPAWWMFLHLVGVFGFLITHGVSIAVSLRLRKERDRDRIRELLTLSGGTIMWMYASLVVLTVGGILRATKFGGGIYWKQKWPKISLAVTFGAILLMGAIARPFYSRIKEVCELRPSGAPRVSDEDLDTRLRGWQPMAIMVVGWVALIALLYMMVFKRPV
jgi:amino acid transporter